MDIEQLHPGDTIFAAVPIYNHGGIPDLPEDALLATPGTRGVIIATGHLEEVPQRKIFLVRFENAEMNPGPPTSCWPEELSAIATTQGLLAAFDPDEQKAGTS